MDKEQIIKIKGKDGGWYQEAIFIMNKDIMTSCNHKDLEQRADMIIGNYAKRNGLLPQKKCQSTDQALNLILFSSIGVLVICLWLL